MRIMRRFSFMFVVALLMVVGARGQEMGDRYKIYNGPYVSIGGKRPIGYKVTQGDITVTINEITGDFVEMFVQNKGESIAQIVFEESYFVINGESGTAIPGETMGFEVNQPIKPRQIAPDSWVRIKLYNRQSHNQSRYEAIFSEFKAKLRYQDSLDREHVFLNVVIDSKKEKFKHEFDFTVASKKEVNRLTKKGERVF